jgi:hypothetical protein
MYFRHQHRRYGKRGDAGADIERLLAVAPKYGLEILPPT